MCLLSKEQGLLSRETIENAFFFRNMLFFDNDFLSFLKHPTAAFGALVSALLVLP